MILMDFTEKVMGIEEKRMELERMLDKYPPTLDIENVASILDVCERTASDLMKDGTISSFVLDETAKRKSYRTTKVDIINYMLRSEQ